MCPKQGAAAVRSSASPSSSSRIVLLLLALATLVPVVCVLVSTSDIESKREEARVFLRSCHNFTLRIAGLLSSGREAYGSRIQRAFFPRSSFPVPHAPGHTSQGASSSDSNEPVGAGGAGTGILSHPAQNVLVEVIGKQSRMGRACLPAEEEQVEVFGANHQRDDNFDDTKVEEYVELVEALTSVSLGSAIEQGEEIEQADTSEEAAVELRPNGAVMPRTEQSFSPWTMKGSVADKQRMQHGDPVVGMTIQVFPLD